MAYYVSEDLKDKRGEIQLDKSCVIEVGEEVQYKHCMFNYMVYRQMLYFGWVKTQSFTAHKSHNPAIWIPCSNRQSETCCIF